MTTKKGMANGERAIPQGDTKRSKKEDNSYSSFAHSPFAIATRADLHRLAAEMRGHVATAQCCAARVVKLGDQDFQLILRPAPDHQTQLIVAGPGYRFPDAWLPDLRAAFGVPDGTLMVYDLVKRHEVVKWTWTEAVEAEPVQMSLAGLEESKSGYYERG